MLGYLQVHWRLFLFEGIFFILLGICAIVIPQIFSVVIKIYLALMMRPLSHWGFVFFSGITALAFAFIILAFWSEAEQWLLGLFLGINMIILGGSLVKVSLKHKDSH